MSAEKIVTFLLLNSPAVVGLVGDRVQPGVAAQGLQVPAIQMDHLVTVPRHTSSGIEPKRHRRTRIQLTVRARSYPEQKGLLKACADACTYRRGTIAGIADAAVLTDIVGPDGTETGRTREETVFLQTLDLIVHWNEVVTP